jgi:hypothetical protein
MKSRTISLLLMLMFISSSVGCQNRYFTNVGNDSYGNAYAAPSNSIDGYAKAHGVSRAEAVKRMREELVPPGDSHINDPPVQMTTGTSEKANQ